MNYNKTDTVKSRTIKENLNILSNYDKRILFLKILCGFKIPAIKLGEKILEVVFSYQDYIKSKNPIQIKYINADEYLYGEEYNTNIDRVYNWFSDNIVDVNINDCLIGYKWNFSRKDKIQFTINKDNKPVVLHNDIKIYCDWFDGSQFVKKQTLYSYDIETDINMMVIRILTNNLKLLDFDANIEARKKHNNLFDLKKYNISKLLLKKVLVKIGTAYDNIIIISHVNRNGNGVDISLDYEDEGNIWKTLNLLYYCYSEAITITGELNFKLNTNSYMYNIMLSDIKSIIQINKENKQDNIITPDLKSNLWDHQHKTVQFILSNVKDGKRGFGDASNVGAGKTLSAIATCIELYKYNNCYNNVLVLLPSANLIDTWIDEIKKHTTNINYILQQANGTLVGKHMINMLNIYI
jgi:hypothetical protein